MKPSVQRFTESTKNESKILSTAAKITSVASLKGSRESSPIQILLKTGQDVIIDRKVSVKKKRIHSKASKSSQDSSRSKPAMRPKNSFLPNINRSMHKSSNSVSNLHSINRSGDARTGVNIKNASLGKLEKLDSHSLLYGFSGQYTTKYSSKNHKRRGKVGPFYNNSKSQNWHFNTSKNSTQKTKPGGKLYKRPNHYYKTTADTEPHQKLSSLVNHKKVNSMMRTKDKRREGKKRSRPRLQKKKSIYYQHNDFIPIFRKRLEGTIYGNVPGSTKRSESLEQEEAKAAAFFGHNQSALSEIKRVTTPEKRAGKGPGQLKDEEAGEGLISQSKKNRSSILMGTPLLLKDQSRRKDVVRNESALKSSHKLMSLIGEKSEHFLPKKFKKKRRKREKKKKDAKEEDKNESRGEVSLSSSSESYTLIGEENEESSYFRPTNRMLRKIDENLYSSGNSNIDIQYFSRNATDMALNEESRVLEGIDALEATKDQSPDHVIKKKPKKGRENTLEEWSDLWRYRVYSMAKRSSFKRRRRKRIEKSARRVEKLLEAAAWKRSTNYKKVPRRAKKMTKEEKEALFRYSKSKEFADSFFVTKSESSFLEKEKEGSRDKEKSAEKSKSKINPNFILNPSKYIQVSYRYGNVEQDKVNIEEQIFKDHFEKLTNIKNYKAQILKEDAKMLVRKKNIEPTLHEEYLEIKHKNLKNHENMLARNRPVSLEGFIRPNLPFNFNIGNDQEEADMRFRVNQVMSRARNQQGYSDKYKLREELKKQEYMLMRRETGPLCKAEMKNYRKMKSALGNTHKMNERSKIMQQMIDEANFRAAQMVIGTKYATKGWVKRHEVIDQAEVLDESNCLLDRKFSSFFCLLYFSCFFLLF